VVSVLDGQPSGRGFKVGSRFLIHLGPLAYSTVMSASTIHCRCRDETAKERTDRPSALICPGKEDMKSLTLHTHV